VLGAGLPAVGTAQDDPTPPACPDPAAPAINGSDGGDVLTGTAGSDRIFRFDGDDEITGAAGDDCVLGGHGLDLIQGALGNDLLRGEEGPDDVSGGHGDDLLRGGSGVDWLPGGLGADRIEGRDDIEGDDVINAANGVRERADCGAGRDRVRADREDRLRDCERVFRLESVSD
jgi:Ca2+-binding RTX toxin-like protein